MRSTSLIIAAAASVAALLAVTEQAQAQLNRTFVSGHGSDSNPCSLAAPCRTFAQALSQTNAGGEIAVLDTAGYGAVTISKSVSIVNPGGVEAGIAVPSGGTGILITGGSVALRGLTLEGAGIGQDGIKFTGGSRLEIVDCVVRDFTHDGIYINHSSGAMTLSISSTIASDNTNVGIDIGPAPGDGTAAVSGNVYQSLTNNNGAAGIVVFGLNGAASLSIAVSGGVSDSNGNNGLSIFSQGSVPNNIVVRLDSMMVSNNLSFGIENDAGFLISSHVKFFSNDSKLTGGNAADINNEGNGFLHLIDYNSMFFLNNHSSSGSDGTNFIQVVSGNALIKEIPQ